MNNDFPTVALARSPTEHGRSYDSIATIQSQRFNRSDSIAAIDSAESLVIRTISYLTSLCFSAMQLLTCSPCTCTRKIFITVSPGKSLMYEERCDWQWWIERNLSRIVADVLTDIAYRHLPASDLFHNTHGLFVYCFKIDRCYSSEGVSKI